jgi:triosephosphate isomerase (TIM)
MRKKIVAGNWKMNNALAETKKLLSELSQLGADIKTDTLIIIAPSFPFLHLAKEMMPKNVLIAAQDVSSQESGAYTGEVSSEMLYSIGIDSVIIGHSERRQYHNEKEAELEKKIKTVLNKGLLPIYCVGETLEQRNAGNHFSVVEQQIKDALFNFSSTEIKNIIIAYEPVWAIGTGETASAEQAQEIHKFIRKILADNYGIEWANTISILYGGSVKPSNAKEIFSQPDVDGGLIGGACLVAEDFFTIINSFN